MIYTRGEISLTQFQHLPNAYADADLAAGTLGAVPPLLLGEGELAAVAEGEDAAAVRRLVDAAFRLHLGGGGGSGGAAQGEPAGEAGISYWDADAVTVRSRYTLGRSCKPCAIRVLAQDLIRFNILKQRLHRTGPTNQGGPNRLTLRAPSSRT